MAKVKSNLKNLSVSNKIQTGRARYATLRSGTSQITVSNDKLSEYNTVIDSLEQKEISVQRLKEDYAQAVAERDEVVKEFERVDMTIVNEINSKSEDRVALLSTGYPLAEERTDAAPLGQVTNLSATIGDDTGEIDISFDRVKNAAGYEFQMAMENPDLWVNAGAAGKISKYTFRGLNIGKKYWFRVRAIRGDEKGAWSDPATSTAPY